MATNELVQSIIKNLVIIFVQYINDIIPFVLSEIQRVSADEKLDSKQKFDAVFKSVTDTYGGIGTSLLRMIIEVCYTFLKAQLPEAPKE